MNKIIEVKGMSGLNSNYIYRFFSHAGPVEEVKKIDDLVIIVIILNQYRNTEIRIASIRHCVSMEGFSIDNLSKYDCLTKICRSSINNK